MKKWMIPLGSFKLFVILFSALSFLFIFDLGADLILRIFPLSLISLIYGLSIADAVLITFLHFKHRASA